MLPLLDSTSPRKPGKGLPAPWPQEAPGGSCLLGRARPWAPHMCGGVPGWSRAGASCNGSRSESRLHPVAAARQASTLCEVEVQVHPKRPAESECCLLGQARSSPGRGRKEGLPRAWTALSRGTPPSSLTPWPTSPHLKDSVTAGGLALLDTGWPALEPLARVLGLGQPSLLEQPLHPWGCPARVYGGPRAAPAGGAGLQGRAPRGQPVGRRPHPAQATSAGTLLPPFLCSEPAPSCVGTALAPLGPETNRTG